MQFNSILSRRISVAVVLLGIPLGGCSREPQLSKQNQPLVDKVYTAVAAHNDVWLASNERLVKEVHEKHQMTDGEFETFEAILKQAREGDWKGATSAARSLSQAQEPNGEISSQRSQKPTRKKPSKGGQ